MYPPEYGLGQFWISRIFHLWIYHAGIPTSVTLEYRNIYICLLIKDPILPSDFDQNWNVLPVLVKILNIKFLKICSDVLTLSNWCGKAMFTCRNQETHRYYLFNNTLDLSNFMTFWLERTSTDLLTSTIIRTVGSVVCRFCGCGGRIVTGTAPIT